MSVVTGSKLLSINFNLTLISRSCFADFKSLELLKVGHNIQKLARVVFNRDFSFCHSTLYKSQQCWGKQLKFVRLLICCKKNLCCLGSILHNLSFQIELS